jgi:hypothetical protein
VTRCRRCAGPSGGSQAGDPFCASAGPRPGTCVRQWHSLGLLLGRLYLPNESLTEPINLLFRFSNQADKTSPDLDAVRHPREAQSATQGRILLQQVVQFSVDEGAQSDGDNREQQKGRGD